MDSDEIDAKNYRNDMTSHGVGATVFTIAHGCYVPTPMGAHWSNAKLKSLAQIFMRCGNFVANIFDMDFVNEVNLENELEEINFVNEKYITNFQDTDQDIILRTPEKILS